MQHTAKRVKSVWLVLTCVLVLLAACTSQAAQFFFSARAGQQFLSPLM